MGEGGSGAPRENAVPSVGEKVLAGADLAQTIGGGGFFERVGGANGGNGSIVPSMSFGAMVPMERLARGVSSGGKGRGAAAQSQSQAAQAQAQSQSQAVVDAAMAALGGPYASSAAGEGGGAPADEETESSLQAVWSRVRRQVPFDASSAAAAVASLSASVAAPPPPPPPPPPV